MKFTHTILFTAMLLTACSQPHEGSYEIATWQGFRQAAVSYTFDDQCPNQFAVALPMFDECGFKVTLYPVTNWGQWDEIRQAAANGHEIGSHTVSHPMLDTLSITDQERELGESREFIHQLLNPLGMSCQTIAYPYCHTGDLATIGKYYIAGRICRQEIVPSSPTDYYNIPSVNCGDQGNIQTMNDFQRWFVSAADAGGWCVLLLHGIDNDGGYSPLSSEVLRESIDYLDKNRETYWVTTFRNAVLYARERDAASVSEKQRTRNKITVELSDTLDDAVYNHPLTLRCPLPSGWKNGLVKQNGETMPSRIATFDQVEYLVFDAVPNKGLIVLERK